MKTKQLLLPTILLLALVSTCFAVETTTQNLIPVSVSVTGDVARPGIYTLTTMSRVSEVLAIAERQLPDLAAQGMLQGDNSAVSVPKFRVPASSDTTKLMIYRYRSVILIREGKRQVLDLLRFQRLGDISQNPYLRDGDVIQINPPTATISLQGSVRRPGDYEFKEGDTLRDILDLALGALEDADLKKIMLFRYRDNFIDFDRLELDVYDYPGRAGDFLSKELRSGDRILVPSNSEFRKAYKVQVTGKVKMPGLYYVDDHTTLYDLLVMCGGPTKEADLNNSFVYNRLVSENYDPDFDRLSRYSYNQMTWLEYSYLRTKTRQLKGKYSINLEKCWESQGKDANLVLRDGDELFVPELINGVWVAGQVRYPGLVTWDKNLKWKDYLESAGGYANNRKTQGTRIIRVHSGNWIKPTDKVQINPGDIIFVPDKEERYLWDDIKDVVLFTSQILTILIALRSF